MFFSISYVQAYDVFWPFQMNAMMMTRATKMVMILRSRRFDNSDKIKKVK